MFLSKKGGAPDDTAFKQQRLPAWQPVLTAKSVFPTFLLTSIVFIPIGVVLLWNSRNVVEFEHDYTECTSLENPLETCGSVRSNQLRMNESCTCRLNFTLSVPMTGNVYAYYGLSNFFQNHRRYVKSRDDNQLIGNHVDLNSVLSECKPYASTVVDGVTRVTAPCGAIANSLFNDTFSLVYLNTIQVPILRTGIAWPSDYSKKFNNPSPRNDLNQAFISYGTPIYWQAPVQYLDNSSIANNGYKNEALIVWMRAAAFPDFRKIYGHLNRASPLFTNGLSPGTYTLTISYNYPVLSYFGKKRFILSTTSWTGGKNDFLGIAYIAFGSVALATGLFLWCLQNHAKKIHAMETNNT